MTSRILERLGTWLVLVLVLVTAATPARGFVLCIEADGCVSVEIKTPDADCRGCDGHDEDTIAASSSDDGACPCVDLAVPGSRHDQRLEARAFQLHASLSIAPTRVSIAPHHAAIAEPVRGPPQFPPRMAETLGHLRSVVLLV